MKAVVLLSGGQDSTTALYHAKLRYEVVQAVSFDYGQGNRQELACARQIAVAAEVGLTILPAPALRQLSQATLTGASGNKYAEERGLPLSYVPGRNLLFVTYGAAVAAGMDARALVVGACADDVNPDSQPEFVWRMEKAVQVGFAWPEFRLVAPFLAETKAGLWRIAEELGIRELIVESTHSCYEDVLAKAPWGYGCGRCSACVKRRRGYEEWRLAEVARASTAPA